MKLISLFNSFYGENLLTIKNIIMKAIDEVIETLEKDSECSKYMLDWILNRIHDLDDKDWRLEHIETGYRLSYETYSFDYFYISFV